jgi:hypothetical protein
MAEKKKEGFFRKALNQAKKIKRSLQEETIALDAEALSKLSEKERENLKAKQKKKEEERKKKKARRTLNVPDETLRRIKRRKKALSDQLEQINKGLR